MVELGERKVSHNSSPSRERRSDIVLRKKKTKTKKKVTTLDEGIGSRENPPEIRSATMPPAVVLDAIIAAVTPWRVGAKSSEEVGVGVVLRFGFCGPIVEGAQAHGGTRTAGAPTVH